MAAIREAEYLCAAIIKEAETHCKVTIKEAEACYATEAMPWNKPMRKVCLSWSMRQ